MTNPIAKFFQLMKKRSASKKRAATRKANAAAKAAKEEAQRETPEIPADVKPDIHKHLVERESKR